MRKRLILSCLAIVFSSFIFSQSVFADGGVNLKISPVSNYFKVKAGDTQNYTLTISNSGENDFSFKLYTAPYIVTDEDYTVSFNSEDATTYNQITRWVTFKDDSGSFVKEPHFKLKKGEEKTIVYRVTVPDDIPDNGQYCVIFAETINDSDLESTGINAISRVALTLVGHGLGSTNNAAEIVDYSVSHPFSREGISASTKVKNKGNTDFEASYLFTVKSIFDKVVFTSSSSYTVLPETERKISLDWSDAPVFGIFKVNFIVSASDLSREEEHVVFILPIFIIVIMLLLLTAIIIWIIILVRKRKERSSRLVV